MTRGEKIADALAQIVGLSQAMSDGATAFGFDPMARLKELYSEIAKLLDEGTTP